MGGGRGRRGEGRADASTGAWVGRGAPARPRARARGRGGGGRLRARQRRRRGRARDRGRGGGGGGRGGSLGGGTHVVSCFGFEAERGRIPPLSTPSSHAGGKSVDTVDAGLVGGGRGVFPGFLFACGDFKNRNGEKGEAKTIKLILTGFWFSRFHTPFYTFDTLYTSCYRTVQYSASLFVSYW